MANAALAPGALLKPTRPVSTAKSQRAVYQHVSDRDGLRCRVCGEYGGIDIHRHHLRGRSFTTVEDVCCLCDECHGFLHVRVGGKRLKVYGNADVRGGLTVETKQNDGTWRVEAGF